MGKMKKIPTILKISAAGLLAAAGCGDPAPRDASPVERNRLVIRLFASMEKGDPASAAAQAAKIRALDPGNSYFAWIIAQQECNRAVTAAQQALTAGDLERAEAHLAEAQRRYPLHHTLAEDLRKVRDMIALRQAFRDFRTGKSLSERELAMKTLTRIAERMHDPALSQAVAGLRKELTVSASPEKTVPPERKK